MSDFSTAAAIVTDPSWIARVQLIVTDAAADIMAESDETPNYEVRGRLARAVVRGDAPVMNSWPRLVMTNESVRQNAVANGSDAVTDSDLQFTVASLWTSVAKSQF